MKISKKLLISLICAFVAVCLATGGTIAYILTNTEEAENTFEPVFVSCQVNESFNGITKSNVNVKNTGDISAYIRATFVVMWVSDSGSVYSSSPVENEHYSIVMGSAKWTKGSDGFYYYSSPVSAGQSTDYLISSVNQISDGPEGYHLSVHIAATAIQSTPYNVVNEAWGAVVQSNGEITPP